MNIEQAKLIPLVQILEKLGRKPTKQKTHELWFISPFREEKTASFHVNTRNNVWYDHGEGMGGDVIKLVTECLKQNSLAHSVSDALSWLKSTTGYVQRIAPVPSVDYSLLDKKLELVSKKKIEHKALIQYLDTRGIPLKIAQQYLQEIRVVNKETQKAFFALGIENEEGGYEFRNKFFKGCVSPKSITFIRGTTPKPKGIHIFEGMFDYLSVITRKDGKPLENDTIILNSLSCLEMARPYIYKYGYETAYLWLDNDVAGEKAKKALNDFFKTEDCLNSLAMNSLYATHKDVNEWHVKQLSLKVS